MKSSKQRKVTRRSFLETALKGGALAGTASLTITTDLLAQASGPLVIGHHCDLTGEATEVTGSKGTRFSFRTGTDTYSIAAASMPWCVENLGKVWSIIYADYAWGQSTNQESKLFIEKAGGKVLTSIPVPLDTKDFLPYVAQVPADSQVVLPAFIGSLSVAFYTQAKTMGLDKKMKMFSSSASLESIAPDDIQGAAEGVYFFENFPRMLKAKDDEFHREFIKRVGIDEVHAREVGGQRVMDKSHGWQSWEDIFALKQAIEKSGYKTRKDVEGVIQALEGMEMKNSLGHPQGDKIIRKEDHVGIIDCYISRVEGGKFEVKKKISKEELARNMPLRHDLSKMPA